MIYADNLGAGYDRKWEYTPDTDLTNLVPDSLDMEAKGPYSDTGYKERCYVVSLKQTIPMDGYVATGLMEWPRRPDNTWGSVYVKGAELDTNDPYVRGLFVKVEDDVLMPTVYISGGTEDTASQNWEDHFIVEKLGEQYYKLTPTGDIYSIGYATQYIQLSLKGTGENLIVTVDEPIE